MVVFIDFDGVLHPEPCYRKEQLFCFLPRFQDVMRGFQSVDVVISSSWREDEGLDQLRRYFAEDIAARIVGTTPALRDMPMNGGFLYPREWEIETWMRRERDAWEAWIAVDDRPYWFRPFSRNLVICDPQTGFDESAAAGLVSKLQAAGRA